MSRMKSPNKIAAEAWKAWLRSRLLEGNFESVEYRETNEGFCKSKQYNMMVYSEVNSTVARVVHDKLVAKGYAHGVFENKRNKQFQEDVNDAIASMTVEDVESQKERFRTMFD